MTNLTNYRNILKIKRTGLCNALFAFLLFAAALLQVIDVELDKSNHQKGSVGWADAVSISGPHVSHDRAVSQISEVDDTREATVLTYVTVLQTANQRQINTLEYKPYCAVYCQFNSLAKALLISYLHQQSSPQ